MKEKATVVKRKTAGTKKKKASPKKKAATKWSSAVTRNSNALDLESNIFESTDPHKIAASLKRSAEKSTRRKGTPLQSAMSMLNFYINRAGKNLTAKEKKPLEDAKPALRKLFATKR